MMQFNLTKITSLPNGAVKKYKKQAYYQTHYLEYLNGTLFEYIYLQFDLF